MAVSSSDVLRVRRLIGEDDAASVIADEVIAATIAKFPREDAGGEAPYLETRTATGTLAVNPDWTPTYDLHAAAAELWEQKAAVLAAQYDFSADGGSYKRSQSWEHAMRMARWHHARRSPTTFTLRPGPAALGSGGRND